MKQQSEMCASLLLGLAFFIWTNQLGRPVAHICHVSHQINAMGGMHCDIRREAEKCLILARQTAGAGTV